jgi:hypothetical protein
MFACGHPFISALISIKSNLSVALYRRSPTEWMTMSGPVGEYNVAGVRIYLQLSPKFAVAVDVTDLQPGALRDAK